jgi:hypothetical protein
MLQLRWKKVEAGDCSWLTTSCACLLEGRWPHGVARNGKVVPSSPVQAARKGHIAFTVTNWGSRGARSKLHYSLTKIEDQCINNQSIKAVNSAGVLGER